MSPHRTACPGANARGWQISFQRPVACFSSGPVFSHWIMGPLTPSGGGGEGLPHGVGSCPLPTCEAIQLHGTGWGMG